MGIRWLGCDVDLLPPCSADVKEYMKFLFMVWCLVEAQGEFDIYVHIYDMSAVL
jgi:hypothetical protein